MSTVIDRLDREAVELEEKWDRLTDYMATDAFKLLPLHHQWLMERQHRWMGLYLEVLVARLNIMEKEQREP